MIKNKPVSEYLASILESFMPSISLDASLLKEFTIDAPLEDVKKLKLNKRNEEVVYNIIETFIYDNTFDDTTTARIEDLLRAGFEVCMTINNNGRVIILSICTNTDNGVAFVKAFQTDFVSNMVLQYMQSCANDPVTTLSKKEYRIHTIIENDPSQIKYYSNHPFIMADLMKRAMLNASNPEKVILIDDFRINDVEMRNKGFGKKILSEYIKAQSKDTIILAKSPRVNYGHGKKNPMTMLLNSVGFEDISTALASYDLYDVLIYTGNQIGADISSSLLYSSPPRTQIGEIKL